MKSISSCKFPFFFAKTVGNESTGLVLVEIKFMTRIIVSIFNLIRSQ